MKSIFIQILLLLIFSSCFSEPSKEKIDLEILIFMDNDPTIELRDFEISDDDLYTTSVNYKTGRIEIERDEARRLFKNENINLKFKYNDKCISHDGIYTLKLNSDLLKQEYFYLRVYNFENYPHILGDSKYYKFEFDSPIGSTRLPTLKNQELERNNLGLCTTNR